MPDLLDYDDLPTAAPMRPGENPYQWSTEHARQHGPVFRLPLRQPVVVLSGADALGAFSDPAKVRRSDAAPAVLEAMLANPASWPQVSPLSLIDGPAHHARAAPVRRLLSPEHLGADITAIAAQMDAAVINWRRGQLVRFNDEVASLCWLVMLRLVFGVEEAPLDRTDADAVFLHGRGHPSVSPDAARAAHERLFNGYRELLTRPQPGGIAGALRAASSLEDAANDAHHMLLAGLNTWMVLVGALRELEAHPTVREALCAEVSGARGPMAAAMGGLPKLAHTVQEVRRLYTLLGWTAGTLIADTEIAGARLPAGATLLSAYYATSRDPSVFSEPDRFVPSRWEQATPAMHASWCAAGAGPTSGHRCPAEDITGVICRIFVASAVRHISWRALSADEPLEHSARGIRPAWGYRALVSPTEAPRTSKRRTQPKVGQPVPARAAVAPDAHVAIVGGGISGLAAARALLRRGFTRVTVFEAAPTVAGKCATYHHEGKPYNLGGHLVCQDKAIRRLAAEVGVALERSYDAHHFSVARQAVINKPYTFLRERARYDALRATLPDLAAPGFSGCAETLAAPIRSWLDHHDLGSLGDLLGPFYTGAGYGFLDDDLPIAYFLKFIETQDLGLLPSATPSGGYQPLLTALARDLDVRCNTPVTAIQRDDHGVTVTTPTGEHRFDEVILACPAHEAARILDATPVETSLFGAIRHQHYISWVVEASGLPREGLFLVDEHTRDPATRGHITAFAHFHADSDLYVAFAYADPDEHDDTIKARLRADLVAMGATAGRTHLLRRWDYFPHVGAHDLSRGYFDHLDALQGQRRTWYATSLHAFELTECVASYADALAERMASPTPAQCLAIPPWHSTQQPATTFPTLTAMLAARLQQHPHKPLYTFLNDRGEVASSLTWQDLAARAGSLARTLIERRDLAPGDRVLLVYPPDSDEFIVAMWACLLGGLVAVPVAPFNPIDPQSDVDRFRHICEDCGATVALTSALYRGLAAVGGLKARVGAALGRNQAPDIPGVRWVITTKIRPSRGVPDLNLGVPITPDTVAYLQYTSGSTSRPRGVEIRHRHAAHNLDLMGWDAKVDADDVILAWVPWYHDMGLVGGFLNTAWSDAHYIYFSPLAFLKDPAIWFRAIHEHRATIISGPNFGYEYAMRRVDVAITEQLDLSSLRVAIQGGEVARAGTLERLLHRLEPQGVHAGILRNVYGLAETVLYLSGARGGPPPLLDVDTPTLETAGRARVVEPAAPGARHLVGSDRPNVAWGMHILIVDPERHTLCPPGAVGEIWAASPSGAQQYYGKEAEAAAQFGARPHGAHPDAPPYLRTGDLGFLHRGQLFVTGRRKEMILVGGRNLYPYDLEDAVSDVHPGLRRGNTVAFSVEEGERERLVITLEIRDRHADPARLRTDIVPRVRARLQERFQVAPDAVVLVPPGALPKTTSGKLQRTAAAKAFREGTLRTCLVHRADGAVPPPTSTPTPAPLTPRVAGTTPAAADLQTWLATRLAAMLGIDPADVDPHQPLGTFGLDSIQLLPFATDLEAHLGRPVPPTALYDYPTLAALCAFLTGEPAADTPNPRSKPRPQDAPLALVSAACRLPGGVRDLDALWELLTSGRDPITTTPASRFDPSLTAGPDGNSHMGIVDGIEQFDPSFFGLSDAEARVLDPQQRVLLELAWEALEAGGVAPHRLQGRRVGVYVGLSTGDYASHNLRSHGVDRVDAWTTTGNAMSVAAGRIAYTLGLNGPTLAVDTACSSGLVALHLAMQDLRRGDAEAALVGAANLILSPEHGLALRRMGALSPTGRCHSFDAGADGYVRSDGAVACFLLPQETAIEWGLPILATLRGASVNHDGRSQTLTAPSGAAQRRLLADALADAGATPSDVGYVEAHGTGTPLGDPIELEALGAVLGQRDRPLLLSSIKATVGHTEAAAGLAGLLRAALSLRHRQLTPTLHFREPTPHVDLQTANLQVVNALTPWPEDAPLAGVSAFGLSGTNAHVILGPPPATPDAEPAPERPLHVLPLSAHDADALAALAQALHDRLGGVPEPSLADWTAALGSHRTPLRTRAAAVGQDVSSLRDSLAATAAGASMRTRRRNPSVGLLLTGQGAARPGMGCALAKAFPVYDDALSAACAALDPHLDRSVRSLLTESADTSPITQTRYAQPALFAVQVAAAKTLEALGLKPTVLLGHSLGGLIAAHLAGVLSLADAARLIVRRGALMSEVTGDGAMAALPVGLDEAQQLLEAHRDLELAADNSPDQVVLTGPASAIDQLLAQVEGRRLRVSHAFHSRQLDPMLDAWRTELETVTFSPPTLRLISETTAAEEHEALTHAETWVAHLREPVRFREALLTAASSATLLLELGPRPDLLPAVAATLPDGPERLALATRDEDEVSAFLRALAALHTAGVDLDWAALDGRTHRPLPPLPLTPRTDRRCWVAPRATPVRRGAHPLLGAEHPIALPDHRLWTHTLDPAEVPALLDHRLDGASILPATAFWEIARAAHPDRVIHDLTLLRPLPLTEITELQLWQQHADLSLRARVGSQPWQEHARWRLGAPRPTDLGALPATTPAEPLQPSALRDALAQRGLSLTGAFTGLTTLACDGHVAHGTAHLPGAPEALGPAHPALLDAALQAFAALAGEDAPLAVPTRFDTLTFAPLHTEQVHLHATLAGDGALTLATPDGQVFLRAEGLHFTPRHRAVPSRTLRWQDAPAAMRPPLVLHGDHPDLARAIANRHDAGNAPPTVVIPPPALPQDLQDRITERLHHAREAIATHADATRFLWITRGAVVATASDPPPDPAEAALWALVRSARLENADQTHTLLDLPVDLPLADSPPALGCDAEDEVAWRDGRRLVARWQPSAPPPPRLEAPAGPHRLTLATQGSLAGLQLSEVPTAPLGAHDVRVAVGAAALNFRDILGALGAYPGRVEPGLEAVGEVEAIGAEVRHLSPGQRVIAIGPGAIATHLTTDANLCWPAPDHLSEAELASLPVPALTAWYALHDLANLQRGERVLIHAAAGGVGLAAVQIAQRVGAEIHATAHPHKWPLLRGLGITHLYSSRSADFAQQVPGPVDVVLNALTGPMLDASLALLRRGGRFIELGKADLRDPDAVGRAFPGVAYHHFDLATLPIPTLRDLGDRVFAAVAAGELRPLPVRLFPLHSARRAAALMARGGHVGRLVITPQGPRHALITGGLGALGLTLACHLLTRHGVAHLTLIGRRPPNPEQEAALDALRAEGAHITVLEVDVSDGEALTSALRRINPHQRPDLIVHAAGVLADATLSHLTQDHIHRALAPKLHGTLHLDAATADWPLYQRVYFSSAAGSLGSPGQAAYAAANAALDALALQHRAQGRPALSLAWGPWSGPGMAAEARLSAYGVTPIAPAAALAAFDRLLHVDASSALLADVRPVPGAETPPRLMELRPAAAPEAKPGATVLDAIDALLGEGRATSAPLDTPLADLGLDSLLYVELAHHLQQATGRRYRPADLAAGGTLGGLLAHLTAAPNDPTRLLLRPSSGTTLYAPPPAGGSGLAYLALARALPSTLGLTALQPKGKLPTGPGAIEALATRMIASASEGRPAGPWTLCGYSMGGLLAWEMARQLLDAGQTIHALLLLDAPAPHTVGARAPAPRAQDKGPLYEALLSQARAAGLTGDAPESALRAELDRGFEALFAYTAPRQPLAIPAFLLRATHHDPRLEAYLGHPAFRDEDFGWTPLLPQLSVQTLPGDHFSLMAPPYVDAVAAAIERALLGLR